MTRSSFIAVLLISTVGSAAEGAQEPAEVRGKLAIIEKGGKRSKDVADAVVWLEGVKGSTPARVNIVTDGKQFTPAVIVVGSGSTVSFPNHDPFNHNVFSVSPEATFDLGLYGRGETRSARFPNPGVVRVYCNIHAQMGAAVVVLDTPFHTQPASDGSFAMANVPPGVYLLNAWHERGGQSQTRIEVRGAVASELVVSLDASGFKPKPHLNKFGKPYANEGRRY